MEGALVKSSSAPADATNTYQRFQHGLGMSLVAKSDQGTGNSKYASYVLQSNELVFTFTAPYSKLAAARAASAAAAQGAVHAALPFPQFDPQTAYDFLNCHGLAVRAVAPAAAFAVQGAVHAYLPFPQFNPQTAYDILNSHGLAVRAEGLLVDDADDAFQQSVANGALPVLPPYKSIDATSGQEQTISEVSLYGDVVLRYVSGQFELCIEASRQSPRFLEHIMGFTGFHEFAEFTAEDVGTLDSGLNSMVIASNNEMVLMPINEPTTGTSRKSQIQTYLEQNEGAGLQHLALKTNDIFHTLREMQARSHLGGFEFMPRPSDNYYRTLTDKIGEDALTKEQLEECEKLGILVDKDDQGILLQLFTKPLGDRPTVFIEIIQRLGCMTELKSLAEAEGELHEKDGKILEQAAGCGGFGKGNFSELFKRIEEYERTLNV
eukprot:gene25336-10993_t